MPVNKMFTGYLEITKRRSGDYLDFYIELEDKNWYYFGYTRGVMQAFSSDAVFVGIINDLALRHRRMKTASNETRYVYMIASDTKLEQFFRSYRQHVGSLEKNGQPAVHLIEGITATGEVTPEGTR
jgi:hypothetical protein